MAEDKFGSGRSLKPLLLVLGVIILAFVGLAIFRVGGSPTVKIQPKMTVIGKKTPITVEVAEPQRGLTHVRIELVQESKSVVLAEKYYSPSSQLPFIGS